MLDRLLRHYSKIFYFWLGFVKSVGKIYTPIFFVFQKRVVNIMILVLRSVSNVSPGNSVFYRDIYEFSKKFEKITLF